MKSPCNLEESASHPSPPPWRGSPSLGLEHGFPHFSSPKNHERELAAVAPDTSRCVDSESAIDFLLALRLLLFWSRFRSDIVDIGHNKWSQRTQRLFARDRTSIHDILSAKEKFREVQKIWKIEVESRFRSVAAQMLSIFHSKKIIIRITAGLCLYVYGVYNSILQSNLR